MLGREVDRVDRLRSFATNAVYDVEAGVSRFVVTASLNEDALRSEAWACRRGAETGCGAPAILGVGRLACEPGMTAFLMKRAVGEPIVAEHRAYREVGARLRRLHDVTLPRFGWLADARWIGRDDFTLGTATWLEFLRSICADALRLTAASTVARATDAAATLESHAEAFAAVDIGSLCHGDLKAAHVFVEGRRFTGLIDWGDAVVGDPLFDIARFAQRIDAASLGLLLEGYDPAGATADELAWRLPLYGALWTLVDSIVDHRLQAR